jgi:hypothetical protein
LKIFACVHWSLVDATMIALFACRRLEQNGNGGANADNNKSWPKSLIISDYGRIWYYNRILLKIGRDSITNVISNTYHTVSVIPYWALMHQAILTSIVNHGSLHLRLPAIFPWGGNPYCALIAIPNVDMS